MDPLPLVTIASAAGLVMSSAATQLGKQSVDSLVELLKRVRYPHKRELISQVESQPETVDVEVIARVLHDEAGNDPQFAAQLQQWVHEQTSLSGNVIFNNGPISGNVTQISNVAGPATFNIG